MKFFLLMMLALALRLASVAQPGALDLSFDPGMGASADVRAMAVQSDGKIIIGGKFEFFDNKRVNYIARLNEDGLLDTSFNSGTGANGYVYAIDIHADDKIVIAGIFTAYNSIPAKGIVRLNPDGSMDTSFNSGTGFNNAVHALVIQNDGRAIAGGEFTDYNGSGRNHLVRINTDGSVDNSFNVGTGTSGTVEDIAIQESDNKILIAGDFALYNGNSAWRIVRLHTDGGYDGSFNSAFGASSVVFAVAEQEDGKIVIGGNFTTYTFQSRNRVAQLNANGTLDGSFDPVAGASGEVNDICILKSGNGFADNFIIVGNFTTYNGAPMNRIARVHPWGLHDITFHPGTGADGQLFAVTLQGNKILIAGNFTEYDGTPRKCIARLYNCQPMTPGTISGPDSTMCPGEILVYSVPQSSDAHRYEWTLPPGWTGSSDSSSIIAVSNGQGGTIYVRAFSDSCGFSPVQGKDVYRIEPAIEPICLVTVDSASTHNILIWEKAATNLIDSFFIYRETSSNIYSKIAAIHYDSLSEYHDYAANPNATSYRYKLSSLDICGVETPKSPFHHSIHLQNLGNGNFQWTFYDIEGASNPVTEFNVYRDAFGNGNFSQIGTVPGSNSTFTDISYSSFPNAIYVVDVNWSISCTPQRGTVNTTRSNIRRVNFIDTLHTGLASLVPENIIIYPNPSDGEETIHLSSHWLVTSLRLFNFLGKEIWASEATGIKEFQIPIQGLPVGAYTLAIMTSAGRANRKVIIR